MVNFEDVEAVEEDFRAGAMVAAENQLSFIDELWGLEF